LIAVHPVTGQSLFTKISTERDCKSAGISDQFCLCQHPQANEIDENCQNEVQKALKNWTADNNCSQIADEHITIVNMSAWGVSPLVGTDFIH
jgi:hypothetical protein